MKQFHLPTPFGLIASACLLLGAFTLRAERVATAATGEADSLALPAATARTPSEIDTFMEKVLARRETNWIELHDHVLYEKESLEIKGPAGAVLMGVRREFTWYVRDGESRGSENGGRSLLQHCDQVVLPTALNGSVGGEIACVPAGFGKRTLDLERPLLQRVGVIEPFSQHRLLARVADAKLVAAAGAFAVDFVPQTLPLSLEEPDHHLNVSDWGSLPALEALDGFVFSLLLGLSLPIR